MNEKTFIYVNKNGKKIEEELNGRDIDQVVFDVHSVDPDAFIWMLDNKAQAYVVPPVGRIMTKRQKDKLACLLDDYLDKLNSLKYRSTYENPQFTRDLGDGGCLLSPCKKSLLTEGLKAKMKEVVLSWAELAVAPAPAKPDPDPAADDGKKKDPDPAADDGKKKDPDPAADDGKKKDPDPVDDDDDDGDGKKKGPDPVDDGIDHFQEGVDGFRAAYKRLLKESGSKRGPASF